MKRRRISISVFLCFFSMMFLLVMGCSSSGGDAGDKDAMTSSFL